MARSTAEKSAMVSAAGLLSGFVTDLFKRLDFMMVPQERVYGALCDEKVVDEIARVIANSNDLRLRLLAKPPEMINIQKVIDEGEYVFVGPELREWSSGFQLANTLSTEFALVNPVFSLSTVQVIEMLAARGYRPASFDEAIVLAAEHHHLGTSSIVAVLDYASAHGLPSTQGPTDGRWLRIGPRDGGRQLTIETFSYGMVWPMMARFLVAKA